MAPTHRDYTNAPLPMVAPPSPNPKPAVQAGEPHAWACRYPFEIGWTHTAQEKWEKICNATTWTESAQKWLYGLTIAVVGVAVAVSIAAGGSCRVAGAQEERLEQVRVAQGVERVERVESIKQLDAEQTERYERIFDLLVKVHSDVQVLKAQQAADDAQTARRPTSR